MATGKVDGICYNLFKNNVGAGWMLIECADKLFLFPDSYQLNYTLYNHWACISQQVAIVVRTFSSSVVIMKVAALLLLLFFFF